MAYADEITSTHTSTSAAKKYIYYIYSSYIVYWRKKEEARQEVGRALHVHNEMVMKEICKGGNKSGLYGHMKMLIEKGKEANDSNVQ